MLYKLKTSLQWHKMRKKSRLLLYVSYVLMSEWAYSFQNTIRLLLMYEVLHKDSMKSEILPHLSVAKRGYASKSN